jgi:S1-C subfamily serine protease
VYLESKFNLNHILKKCLFIIKYVPLHLQFKTITKTNKEMRKITLLLLVGIFAFSPLAKADEGMWLLMHLDKQTYKDMKAKGLKLTSKQIYDINNACLKDAIIQFGRGCTGEIVSEQGLILTNHHCGYPQIQQHSSVEHDYLSNGFWAYSKEEELPNPGLTAKFFIRMEDVSTKVLAGVNSNMTEEERAAKVRENSLSITKDLRAKSTDYVYEISTMFNGNQYFLFVYQVYEDVRLVGAPPSSIGKFGSDTDNWMWPRHTCDFSVFRVYADKDGKPAKFSKDNVPLKPKHYLPISLKGVKNNDFVMVIGFPGSTERFLTSEGVKQAIDVYNPSVVTARTALREVMDADMRSDAKIRIQYATKFAQLSNYWKYYIGQTKCLKDLNVFGTKKALEDRFATWFGKDKARQDQYGSVLGDLTSAFEQTNAYDYLRVYTNEAVFRGASVFQIALSLRSLQQELEQNGKSDKAKEISARIKDGLADIFKDCNQQTEERLMASGLEVYFKNVPIKHQSQSFLDYAFSNAYDFKAITSSIFKTSSLVDINKLNALLDAMDAQKIAADPAYNLTMQLYDNYVLRMKEAKAGNEALNRAERTFVKGILEMDAAKPFAPDANLTIRYTYGQVKPYNPSDGITFNYLTTLDGVIAKTDPTSWEFDTPQRLIDLYHAKDYGQYAVNGTVPVCFLSNLDITGGNSGSPTINGQGELVGIAFDGNWEAMSGNIAFNPDLQRCISVDIRYVLFIIDKYAGATNLIKEMKIVK